jgi:hypothetical protein
MKINNVFPKKKGVKIFMTMIFIFIISLCTFFFVSFIGDWYYMMLTFVFLLIGVLLQVATFKYRIELCDNSFVIYKFFSRKEFFLDDIKKIHLTQSEITFFLKSSKIQIYYDVARLEVFLKTIILNEALSKIELVDEKGFLK